MESLVFRSPKKHRIIAIKRLLIENNIPITSIKLHTFYERNYSNGISRITEKKEECDELNVPIEEFDEKLNDMQIFELYTDEKYEDTAISIIDNCDVETFFDDCIFRSKDYDETFEVYLLLKKNNISCDDIFTSVHEYSVFDEYLLFIEPENKTEAIKLIEQRNKVKTYEYQKKTININQFNNDNIFKEEKISLPKSPVRKYYILLGIILISIIMFIIFVIVSAAQPKNTIKDNTLTQLYYYEIYTVSNENFITVPRPVLYFDPRSWQQSIKDYRDQVRTNASNLYSSKVNVTHNDIYEYLINFGLTPMESDKRISSLNTMGNLIISRHYQDNSGVDMVEVTYIEKK
jgi:hypothetical protein